MIETREECEAFVGACSFPPPGNRSLQSDPEAKSTPCEDYAEHANDTVSTLAMIETQKGYGNRDDIMSVEGLDGVFISIGDLPA